MHNPCHKHCPDRDVACHSSCKEYKAYREYLDDKNEQIRQDNAFYGYQGKKRIEREKKLLKHSPKYTGGNT